MNTATAAAIGTAALIDHIVTRYHDTHRRELPELIRLAQRVEALHRDDPRAPRGLAALLQDMRTAMDAHMLKEEQGLFPAMRAGDPVSPMAIEILRDEHDDHGAHLRQLDALSHRHIAPPDACATWTQLCAGTAKLADDLAEHIRLENEVLFPRFAA